MGIISETAPDSTTTYYQYDGFNRLHKQLDHQNNVLKQYEYSYAGVVEPSGTQDKYTVFIVCTPIDAGAVTGSGAYASGTYATVTATPSSHYSFNGWYENGRYQGGSSYTFMVSKNRTLTAKFIHKPYHNIWLSESPSGGGTVTGGGSFIRDTVITVSVAPNSGYVFEGWYEGSNKLSSNLSYNHTVTKDCTLEARLIATVPYTITAVLSPSGGGAVAGAGSYVGGSNVTLTAIANSGYTFAGWKENGVWIATAATNTLSFTATKNRSLEAVFASGSPGMNDIHGEYKNGMLCVTATYPVTTKLEVLFRGDLGARTTVFLHAGQTETCVEEEDRLWEYRYPLLSSDSYFIYR